MNTFNDRKKAFEAKFTQDADLQFKLKAKRNKLIGEWAAEKLQKENKEKYIKEVRESDLEKPGDEDIIEKIMQDFSEITEFIGRLFKGLYKTIYFPFSTSILYAPLLNINVALPEVTK